MDPLLLVTNAAAGSTDESAIDEAVTLARSLSTDESPAFVNGLLGRLLDLKPELTASTPPPTDPADASTT